MGTWGMGQRDLGLRGEETDFESRAPPQKGLPFYENNPLRFRMRGHGGEHGDLEAWGHGDW